MEDLLQKMERELAAVKGENVSLRNRLEVAESEIDKLKAAVFGNPEPFERTWETNVVTDWMIKLVYPGIYVQRSKPTAGFPTNRRKTAALLRPGQMMYVYATSPVKKIIGLTRVTSTMTVKEGRWPFSVDLEWVIGPKLHGVTLEECGLPIRPRPGDTLYSITEDTAKNIAELLKAQPDLTKSQWDLMVVQYRDDYKESVSFDTAIDRLREAGLHAAADELETFAASDGTRRGWDEMASKGSFHARYPAARSIIWPETYGEDK